MAGGDRQPGGEARARRRGVTQLNRGCRVAGEKEFTAGFQKLSFRRLNVHLNLRCSSVNSFPFYDVFRHPEGCSLENGPVIGQSTKSEGQNFKIHLVYRIISLSTHKSIKSDSSRLSNTQIKCDLFAISTRDASAVSFQAVVTTAKRCLCRVRC